MTKDMAQKFYEVHKDRPFFNDLVDFMISGPVIAQVLRGENAVKLNRDIMGATNPKEAEKGTIRKFTDKIVPMSENVTKYNGKMTLFLK